VLRWILSALLSLHLSLLAAFSQVHHIQLAAEEQVAWEKLDLSPFDELILTWNGQRPERGHLIFYISILSDGEWSPEIPYMRWGAEGQCTLESLRGAFCQNQEDSIFLKRDRCGTGFRIAVSGEEGASPSTLRNLTACTSRLSDYQLQLPTGPLRGVKLNIRTGRSQMTLDHLCHRSLCSPTATSTAINYLLKARRVDPIRFAEQVRDQRIDIYGNWVLNMAQAAAELGPKWTCYVARLKGFEELHARLIRGLPVVVSVKGEIPGAPLPYSQGHLLLIRGYDPATKRVLVIDSAFPTDAGIETSYALDDFLAAWSLRKNVAYIFEPTRNCPIW
jgi:Peptidase_C39 like family